MSQKFCTNCGSPLPPGATQCPKCGVVIPMDEPTQQQQTPHQPGYTQPQPGYGYQPSSPYTPEPPKDKTLLKVLVGLIAALLVAAIGIGIWYLVSKNNREAAEQKEQVERMKASQDSIKASNAMLEKKLNEKLKEPEKVKVIHEKPVSVPSSRASEVVINGTGVRMRVGPGRQYGFPQYYNGKPYTVPKGTSLPYLGTYGNWYKVLFEGDEFYVSADFAYLR